MKTFLLLVALANHYPDRAPDWVRVTVVSTKDECETIGKDLVARSKYKWRSDFRCESGDFTLGPITKGWHAGGKLLDAQ